VPILLQKSFWGLQTKILKSADASYAPRREGPCRFTQNRSRTSVVAVKSDAAAEKSKINYGEIFRVVRFSTFATNADCVSWLGLISLAESTVSVEFRGAAPAGYFVLGLRFGLHGASPAAGRANRDAAPVSQGRAAVRAGEAYPSDGAKRTSDVPSASSMII
jgi:hypothetical protein